MTGSAAERDQRLYGSGGETILLGRLSPWYTSNIGYFSYNPWMYGSSRFAWYRNYYDPFGSPYGYGGYYDPWYDSGYYGGSNYGSGNYSSSRGSQRETTGSIRVRVKPAQAKVYLDGTLIGTVDEFDGLSSHLAAEEGTHQLEFRADGYVSAVTTVKVEAGKTITARASMKKK